MKSTPPRFSIVTINLNNRAGLEKTVQSVIKQECADYEYIIIDGGSSDGSAEIIKKYQNSLSYWVSERDTGIYNAMNKGLKQAHGEYVCFLNSGDCFYSPQVLADMHREGTVSDVLCGRVITVGGPSGKASPPWKNNTLYFIIKNFCHQAAFMRTRLCHKHQFDETYKICADRKMLLSLLFQESATFKPINAFIAYFDATGISHTAATTMLEEDARSLKETLPAAILDDYRLLLASPIAPYYMDMLVNFKTPRKNTAFSLPASLGSRPNTFFSSVPCVPPGKTGPFPSANPAVQRFPAGVPTVPGRLQQDARRRLPRYFPNRQTPHTPARPGGALRRGCRTVPSWPGK